MPSSIDMPLGNAVDYAVDAPLAFRRARYWFLSFVMTPFQDIDGRALEQSDLPQPARRRRR